MSYFFYNTVFIFLVGSYSFTACALFRGTTRAASYGDKLLSCEEESVGGTTGWTTYTPCCVSVNQRYPLAGGGLRDASDCYPQDGGE